MRPELVGKPWTVAVRDDDDHRKALGAPYANGLDAVQAAHRAMRDRREGSIEVLRPDGIVFQRFVWDPSMSADGTPVGWRISEAA